MSSGLSLIFGIVRTMNMAHASFYAIGAYLCIGLYASLELDFFLSIFITMVIMAVVGYLIYRFLSIRTRTKSTEVQQLQSLLTTRVLSYIIVAALALGFTSVDKSASTLIPGNWHITSVDIAFDSLVFAVISIVLVTALFCFINYTKTGKSIKAFMQNREAAVMMGIDPQRTRAVAFIIGTVLAAIGGYMMAPIELVKLGAIDALQFKIIMIVIISGIGSISGIIAVACVLGFTEAITAAFWGGDWSTALVIALTITIFAIKPKGLFGYRYTTS